MDISQNGSAVQPVGLAQKIGQLLDRHPIILQLLRFAAIGVINTALDFIVLNVVSKTFNVTSGLRLGQINIIGFSLAVIQSYFWNRYWVFGQPVPNEAPGQMASLWQNFVRLVLIGILGAAAVLVVLFGSNYGAPAGFFLIILAIFIILEIVFWFAFGLNRAAPPSQAGREFVIFLVVSIIGLGINSILIGLISKNVQIVSSADLNKNLAKIVATLVSLVWNFIGYKLFVFKRR